MDEDITAARVIAEAISVLNPETFVPFGPDAPVRIRAASEIPQTIDELTTQISRTYDLSVTAAGQLNIPVVGSVSGGVNRRVVVLERTAFKEIIEQGIKNQFGYAIRLALTVNKVTAEAKLNLPFLAASAELGQIEAKWTLQVVGLAGPKIDSALLPPKELNLETFVLANQSLDSLIKAVRDPSTIFKAQLIAVEKPADILEREILTAIGKVYSLGRFEKGKKRGDAIKELEPIRDEVRDAIVDMYKDFAGITTDTETPSAPVRTRATTLLGQVRVEPR